MKTLKYLLLAVLFATASFADPLVIGAGKAGRGYDKAAQEMAVRLGQRGVDASVLNMAGSDEISLAVCNDRAQVGIMQIDAIYARALEGCILNPIGIYSTERAYLMFPPKSPYDELDDLTEANKLLVADVGSGSDLFWHTIVKIEQGDDGSKDAWSKVTAVNAAISKANTLASFGKVDGLIIVTKPGSDDLKNLLALDWTIAELWDKDVNDLEFSGKPLYDALKDEQGNWVYEVRSFIVTTDTFDAELADKVQAVLN